MRPLIFKTEYLELIKKGLKTQTIRNWVEIPRGCEKGAIVKASNYRETIILRIKNAYKKPISELTESEAIFDGFSGRDELLRVLVGLYGQDALRGECVVIRFEYI